MTSRRRYSKLPTLPAMRRQPDGPPFVRRCPSGEYEVLYQGLILSTGFDTFDEAALWIKEGRQVGE